MATDDCNADGHANDLFTSLTADAPTPPTIDFNDSKFNFELDKSTDLYDTVTALTLEDLTEVSLEGDGAFDKLMCSIDLHIEREFKNSRITGDQYAKVYTEVTVAVLNTATQFLLQKDQAHWNAVTAQMEARIAEIRATEALVNLEKVKAETAKMVFDMQNSGAQYALTKMEIANSDAQYCLTKSKTAESGFNVSYLLPAELAIQEYQRMQVLPSSVAINQVQSDRLLPAEAAIKEYTHREMMPVELATAEFTLSRSLPAKVGIDEYQLNSMLPVALGQEQHKLNTQMPAQSNLIKEQVETQRAQTLDNRTDGLTPVSGMLGRQKDSVIQEIASKKFNVDEVLPVQLELVKEQVEVQRAQTLDDRTDGVTPISGLLGKQKDSIVQDIASKQYNVDFVLPIQLDLVKEQREAERAKTLDTRTDNSAITGSIGKQKDLYTQQIDSFIKDSKHKAAKFWLDGYITQKTLDEGTPAPDQLTQSNINTVLTSLRTENGL